DCRSGVCRPAYLWFNGYLSPSVINAAKNGITGVPANYTPYLAPVNNVPGAANFGNNNVTVTLNNGTQVVTGYTPGPVNGTIGVGRKQDEDTASFRYIDLNGGRLPALVVVLVDGGDGIDVLLACFGLLVAEGRRSDNRQPLRLAASD